MMNEIVTSYDPELYREVFSKMANQNVSIIPTLHLSEILSEILQVDHSEDSLLPYIGDKSEETYQGRLEAAKRAEAAGNNFRAKMSELTQDMILPMYDAGVNIVAVSDCGAFNSFVYPGESLHQELGKLVEAGLSPRQALENLCY